jgi:sugar lactone lactonase YvrE
MGSPEFVNPFISPDPLPGRSALLTDMDGLAVDAAGNTYVSQFYFNVVFRLGQDGLLGAAAGNTVEDWWRGPAVPVCTLEEGPALRVPLCGPTSMAVGPGNSLHISETRAHAVRRLDGNGNLLVVAGTGTAGDTGDLGPALQARLNEPRGLLFLADGSLLIADALANRVRRVDPDGTIHAWAGTGAAGSGGDLGPATEATLNQPTALARDALSNVYIAERAGNRVRRVAPGGTITTVAGTGTAGNSGDNGPATLAQLNRPLGLWAEGAGTLWIADTRNNVVRHVDWEGTITRVAGNGDAAGPYQDFQPALTLALRRPTAVVRDSGGRLIIAESSQYVLRQLEEGVLSTLAGLAVVGDGTIRQAMPWAPQEMVRMGESAWAWMDGYQWLLRRMDLARDKVEAVAGCVGGFPLGTEPRPAGQAELRPFMDPHASSAVTWAPELSRFFLSVDHRILEVQVPVQEDASTWVMAPFTGVAGPGFQDGGLAVAQFSTLIDGLTWDGPRRRLLVADTRNHCIRVVDVDTHQVSTLAGIPGVDGVTLSPAPMENALLGSVSALVVAGDGSIYAASAKEHRVWHLDAQGTARHVLGTGAPNSGGEGSPAARSGVNNPAQLQVDPYGNLWVASQDSVRVVVAGDDGVATGADPVRTVFGAPPRDRFPATSLDHVSGVALTADGASAMVNDLGLNLVVRLDRRRLP